MPELTLQARDGRPLAGTLHEPSGAPRAAVLFASATAVRRIFYGRFAGHLADAGLAVLTFDYRGIGDSRRGPVREDPARMIEWGRDDIGGALDFLRQRYPGLPLLHMGHSGGGWLLGMASGTEHLSGVLTVASQDGHWSHWSGVHRLAMLLFWYGLLPFSVRFLGYLPGWAIGGAENLPAGVARDWGSWGRSRRYLADAAVREGWTGYTALRAPLRAYAIRGDMYAPPRAVERLPDLYPNARAEIQILDPRTPALAGLDHFSVFRPRYLALWDAMRDWLLATAAAT